MIIKNAKVFMDTSGCFEHLDILVRDGKIAEIAEVLDAEEEAEILDGTKWALRGKANMIQEIAGLVREEISARRSGTWVSDTAPPPKPGKSHRQPMR